MSDKFFIKHDNMILLANEMGARLNTWISNLNEIMDGFNRFVNMEGFTGNMADRAREYCELYYGNNSMVSFPILITEAACAIKNAMVVYEKNFLDFDSIEKFSISEEELDFLAEDLRVDAVEVLEDIHNSFINIIDSVSDIITLTKPDYTKYLEDSEDIANNLETVKEKIYEIEENEKPNITELNEQLDSLIALVKSMSDKEKRVTSFVSSNEIITKELKDALEQYEKSYKKSALNAEIIEAAYVQHEASMERIRKEQAKLRKKQGILKGIQGAFATGTGILCIIGTAGAGTPIVVAGGMFGGGSILFGTCDMTEGCQDIYYGSIGDIDSASLNLLRDSLFQGNQELYDITENYFVSGASAMIPLGKAETAMTGAAKELTEKALISEAKLVIVDIAVSESASYGVAEYCDYKGIDGVDKMFFQAAASYLASSAVAKVNELFSNNKNIAYEIVEEDLSNDINTDIKAGNDSHLDCRDSIINGNDFDNISENRCERLLPGEGDIGTYKDLVKAGKRGDNLTPHHMPSAEYMLKKGVKYSDGLCMNMEMPVPGSGGRHRLTNTYGGNMTKVEKEFYYSLTPREALAYDINDVRIIYQSDGLYNEIRPQLIQYIKTYKSINPELFEK